MKSIGKFCIAVVLGGAAVGCAIAAKRLIEYYQETRDQEEGSPFKTALRSLHASSLSFPHLTKRERHIKTASVKMATSEERSPNQAEFALINLARTAGWPADNESTCFGLNADGHVAIRMLTDYGHVELARTPRGSSFFITAINNELPPQELRGLNVPFAELEKIYG